MNPDHLGYTVPGETDDPPRTLTSEYTEATEPAERCTNVDSGMHITLWHVQQFVDLDTEDPDVRFACLVADLGFKPDEDGFWMLTTDYRDPMTPEYADRYLDRMRVWLHRNGVRP